MSKYIEFTDKQINANNRRTLKKGLFSNLNKEQLNDLISKYFRDENGSLYCAYSGEVIKNKKDLALEHIIPVNRSGSSVIFNVCPTLTLVNTSKRDNELLTWWQEQEFYDIDKLRNLTMYILEAYDVFFNENAVVIEESEIEENIEELEIEEYDKTKRIKEEELEHIDYSSLLNSVVYELSKNGITLENIDKENKYGIDYKKIYDEIIFNNYFKDCKKQEIYQRTILKYLDIYAKERKYIIATNINYKEIYQGINKILEEENVKEEDKQARIDYLIHNRITFLRNKVAIKLNSNDTTILETIIDMPELLYKSEEEFTKEYIEEVKDNLPMNKYIRFQYLIEFYKEKGRWPKLGGEIYKGIDVGRFLTAIKRGRDENGESISTNTGHTKINTQQVEALLKLDSNVFKNFNEIEKNNKINTLIEFYQENGRWPIAKKNPKNRQEDDERKQGNFLINLRQGKINISAEQKQMLLELDPNVFDDRKNIEKNNKFDLLIEFYQKNGRWPKTGGEIYKQINIGNFFHNIKCNYVNLNEEQINTILGLDPTALEDPRKTDTNNKINLLIEFYQENGRWPKQSDSVIYNGMNIYTFLNSIRNGNTKISESQKQELISLDTHALDKPKELSKNKNITFLLEFYTEYGRWPIAKEVYKERNIGKYLSSIRNGNTKISEEQRQRLLELDANVFENPKKTGINNKISLLQEFYQENGRWPKQVEEYKEEKVGIFLSGIRSGHTSITEEQKELLLELDSQVFEKNRKLPIRAKNKDVINRTANKFNLLVEYAQIKKMNGKNIIWPKQTEEYEGERIGTFLSRIKSGHTSITKEQREILLELDSQVFDNTQKRIKDYKFNLLVEYAQRKKKNGENKIWPKTGGEMYKGEEIGTFLGSIKSGHTSLTEKEKEKLLELDNNVFENYKETDKNNKIDLLMEFYKTNQRWPKYDEKYKDEKLGVFLSCIRTGNTKITEEQKEQLLALDPTLVIQEKRKKIKKVKSMDDSLNINEEYEGKRHVA